MATHSPGIKDGSAQPEPAYPLVAPGSYQFDLPEAWLDEQGNMLDWVIGLVFDTLHARHLALRIVADAGSSDSSLQDLRTHPLECGFGLPFGKPFDRLKGASG